MFSYDIGSSWFWSKLQVGEFFCPALGFNEAEDYITSTRQSRNSQGQGQCDQMSEKNIAQFLLKVWKSTNSSFTLNVLSFKIAQKVSKYFASFVISFATREFSKIAQSGHTAQDGSRRYLNCILNFLCWKRTAKSFMEEASFRYVYWRHQYGMKMYLDNSWS